MLKILAAKPSMDSAMKLRDSIERILNLSSKTIKVTSDSGNCEDHSVIMRYGCSYGNLQREPVWGDKDFTSICIDKLKFSNLFSPTIRVPTFVNESVPLDSDYPVLVRSTLTSSQSEGVNLAHNQQEFLSVWKPGSYWTKFFRKEFELRVYAVFLPENDIKWRVYKKVPRTGNSNVDDFICGANGEDNTMWSHRDTSYFPKVRSVLSTMRTQVLSLGGRFVALDMIYVPDIREYVTLELNSGPWLNQSTSDWLAEIFVNNNRQYF